MQKGMDGLSMLFGSFAWVHGRTFVWKACRDHGYEWKEFTYTRFCVRLANSSSPPPDLSELSLGSTMKTEFPDPDNILSFILYIEPDEGMYRGGRFSFTFNITPNFPHEPPKVQCREKIYHPNIDLEGKVCLNILREDWKPVLNLNAVIVGLQFLFLEPNASDPLNKEAAEDLRNNREGFKRNVRSSMNGGSVKGNTFDRVSK